MHDLNSFITTQEIETLQSDLPFERLSNYNPYFWEQIKKQNTIACVETLVSFVLEQVTYHKLLLETRILFVPKHPKLACLC